MAKYFYTYYICLRFNYAEMQPLGDKHSNALRYWEPSYESHRLNCHGKYFSEQDLRTFFGNWNINNKWAEQHVVDLDGCDKSSWHHCRGTSGLDIDLRVVDINQCHANTSSFNIFGGTDKCKKETTTVNILSRPRHWLLWMHPQVFIAVQTYLLNSLKTHSKICHCHYYNDRDLSLLTIIKTLKTFLAAKGAAQ